MLEIENLYVSYGNIEVLHGISATVKKGETVALVGANGAGKSTLLNTIVGILKVSSGTLRYKGENITHMPSYKAVSKGIAYVPEGRRIFGRMTVEENLLLGAYQSRNKKLAARDKDDIYKKFPRLAERKYQRAGTLSGGEQQMLAIGRAMMSNPEIVLMDEPSMGLSPIMTDEIYNIIAEMRRRGITVFLVEQNVNKALTVSDRVYAIENGRITIAGAASELQSSRALKKIYLGG